MALTCVGCLEPFSACQVEHLGVIEVDKYWLNAPLLSISLVRGGGAAIIMTEKENKYLKSLESLEILDFQCFDLMQI